MKDGCLEEWRSEYRHSRTVGCSKKSKLLCGFIIGPINLVEITNPSTRKVDVRREPCYLQEIAG